jgi:predicted dehydrogenase
MNLTPEQETAGRRNFLKVLAGTPALAALGAAAAMKGPWPGGPVRLGFIGVGGQGRTLLKATPRQYAEIRALCDVNPTQIERSSVLIQENGHPPARHYAEWRDMLQKEDLEGIVIAAPLWNHADMVVGCLEAGKHVLCEKMMAWDVEGCDRMRSAAERTGRILEIGYQRYYNPMYEAAYEGIIKSGALGEVYLARLVWHRNANWRRKGEPPSPDYDPSRWGYPTFEHLLNWRLYWKYSQGLFAELGSHQVNVSNWFFGADPTAVAAAGGVCRFRDGREVPDHVYGTFEYPGGRTAVFSSIESNAFDENYEMFFGTKGTLILKLERDAYLFEEGSGAKPTTIEVTPQSSAAVLDASETVSEVLSQARSASTAGPSPLRRDDSYQRQVERFCAAVRVGTPIACGPDRAYGSARACIRANEAMAQHARLTI